MRADLYQEMYQQESTYWWHAGKREVVFQLLAQCWASGPDTAKMLLNVGCGTGLMLEQMGRYGRAVGIDLADEALAFCRRRGHGSLIKADAGAPLPFADNAFDLVTALDLLEHLEKDAEAVRQFHRVLKRGGLLVLTVPSFPSLWSYWDEMVGHKRRYTTGHLAPLLREAEFTINKISYSSFFIFPPAVLVRKLKALANSDHRTQSSDFMPVPALANAALKQIYRLEAMLLRRYSFPFGLSIICLAEKR